jgi:hypothetical protein
MKPIRKKPPETSPVWILVRDIGVLQVKLLVDGLRDLLLVPASLIAGIVSLAGIEGGRPGKGFYEVVSIGRQSERWINLFGALRNAPADVVEPNPFGETDIDELVARVENYMVDEYRRGGVTAQAKARLDKVLASIRRNRGSQP